MRLNLVATMAGIAMVATANAAVLCKTRTGTVKVRATCKASETRLDPVAFGLEGTTTPGTGALVVKDANGALVGQLLEPTGPSQHVHVVRRIGDAVVYLYATTEGFFSGWGQVWFEAADCSGPALYLVDFPQVALANEAQIVGSTIYYPTGPIGGRSVQSRLQSWAGSEANCTSLQGTFTPPNLCCEPQSGTLSMQATGSVDLATLGLVPPFHVEGP